MARSSEMFKPRDNNHFHISTFSESAITKMPQISFRATHRTAAQLFIGAQLHVGNRIFQITETWGFAGESRYAGLYGQTPGTLYANPNMGSVLPLVRVGEPGAEVGDCILIRSMRLVEGPEIDIMGKGISKRDVSNAPGGVAKVLGLTKNGERRTLRILPEKHRELELIEFMEESSRRESQSK